MAADWQINKGGKQYGPYSSQQLVELAKRGQLAPTDLVWKPGMREWRPAKSVNGLVFPHAVAPPMPPPSYPYQHPSGGDVKSHRDDQASHQKIATWVFGSILMVFFLGVFMFAPKELPEFKQRMLAFASATLAGLFGFFFTGTIHLELKVIKKVFGDLGVKATGGMALFVFVMAWWLSPLAPVETEKKLREIQAETSAMRDRTQSIEIKLTELGIELRNKIGANNLGPEYDKTHFHTEYQDAYLKKGGKVEALIDEYRQYVAAYPKNAMYRYLLARMYDQADNQAEAVKQARAGLQADPSYRMNRRLLLYSLLWEGEFDLAARLEMEAVHYGVTDQEKQWFTNGDSSEVVRAYNQIKARFQDDPLTSNDLGRDFLCWHLFPRLTQMAFVNGQTFQKLVGKEAVAMGSTVRLKVLEVKTGLDAIPLISKIDLVRYRKEDKELKRYNMNKSSLLYNSIKYPPIAIRISLTSANPDAEVRDLSDRHFSPHGQLSPLPQILADGLFGGAPQLTNKDQNLMVQMDNSSGDGVGSDVKLILNPQDFWLYFSVPARPWSPDKEEALRFRFSVHSTDNDKCRFLDEVIVWSNPSKNLQKGETDIIANHNLYESLQKKGGGASGTRIRVPIEVRMEKNVPAEGMARVFLSTKEFPIFLYYGERIAKPHIHELAVKLRLKKPPDFVRNRLGAASESKGVRFTGTVITADAEGLHVIPDDVGRLEQ